MGVSLGILSTGGKPGLLYSVKERGGRDPFQGNGRRCKTADKGRGVIGYTSLGNNPGKPNFHSSIKLRDFEPTPQTTKVYLGNGVECRV